MMKVLWKLYYGVINPEYKTKSDIVKRYCRLNGNKIIDIKLSFTPAQYFIGVPKQL